MWELFEKNTVALVTGASRGIGKAVALELGMNGAIVFVNYVKSEEAASSVCQTIIENGGVAFPIKADVKNSDEVEYMLKIIRKQMGKLDVLVNNAGITDDGFTIQMSPNKFNKVIETNLNGCFYVTKNALLMMCSKKNNGGSIVNIASTSGIDGQEGQANYAAAKGGIIAFSKVIAREYASKLIRCNVVAPGFVETDMTDKLSRELKEKYSSFIPLNRYGKPQEIANVVAFLASSKSSYITGKVITADGGLING